MPEAQFVKHQVWDKTRNRLVWVKRRDIDADADRYEENLDLTAINGETNLRQVKLVKGAVVPFEQADIDAQDAAILAKQKKEAIEAVDTITEERIQAQTFEYPADSGNHFSLSLPAQIKWAGLHAAKDAMTYPIVVPLADDSGTYSIADAATVTSMFQAAVAAVHGVLDAGTTSKTTINAAADKAAIDTELDTYKGS